jgi:putative membrane protein
VGWQTDASADLGRQQVGVALRIALVRLVAVAIAFAIAAAVFDNFNVPSDGGTGAHALNYLIDALVFGVLNMTVGAILRLFTLPLRVLTFGLFSIVINAILILIMNALPANHFVKIETNFLGALGAALTIAVVSGLADLAGLTKPREDKEKK